MVIQIQSKIFDCFFLLELHRKQPKDRQARLFPIETHDLKLFFRSDLRKIVNIKLGLKPDGASEILMKIAADRQACF